MNYDYTYEICVDSVESAINAGKGSRKRLELCSNLVIGGTTPTESLFNEVRKNTELPIHVLIRPRFGDFLYSEHEVNIIKNEVIKFRELGANGIVVGMLDKYGEVDIENMKKILAERGNMKVTFHRAFDMCKNPIKAFKEIRELGVDIVLTSGQKKTAIEGKELIKELVKISKEGKEKFEKGFPEVMMACGFKLPNEIGEMLNYTHATSFHMSAKKIIDSEMEYRNSEVNMGLEGFSEYQKLETDKKTVEMYYDFLCEFIKNVQNLKSK